ncbi:hemolysin III [Ekhidna lutea]|uniref:Hemolysin III n=1 Tax=Ekhidna lutea TaxID=447679 RepID=A0A239K618_EKHLU|nr:hemolysin III family protein [Ekhidna lutea]SNT13400.1 hemolysin III [Ekhidna lutea]
METVRYSVTEERLNVITHAIGVIFGAVATGFMLLKTNSLESRIAVLTFGISLILLYTASTLYHLATKPEQRVKLRIFDHAAIYVLIAGTYTPVCMITLSDSIGFTLLIIIWSVAICGVTLKLFFTGRFDRLSTIMYIAMGWIALFAIKPLLSAMNTDGLLWMLYGGIFYTIGAGLYSIRSIPFNHAIFHVCVLGGSICHFIMVYFHVL